MTTHLTLDISYPHCIEIGCNNLPNIPVAQSMHLQNNGNGVWVAAAVRCQSAINVSALQQHLANRVEVWSGLLLPVAGILTLTTCILRDWSRSTQPTSLPTFSLFQLLSHSRLYIHKPCHSPAKHCLTLTFAPTAFKHKLHTPRVAFLDQSAPCTRSHARHAPQLLELRRAHAC